MPVNARQTALKALMRYRKDAAFSDAALNGILLKEQLEGRDAALAARLFYGVLQNMALLDWYISAYSSVRPEKMEPQVLDILRLSVYQLTFMSKIPVNAAVSEGVELTKKHANPRAAGLVNAVLRKIAANKDRLPEVSGVDIYETLSIRYSHPRELVKAFCDRLGTDGAEALLKANNEDAPVTVMVNTLKVQPDTVLASLMNDGVEGAAHPWLENCLELRNARNIERLSAFKEGSIYVQDAGAALAVRISAPKQGMSVIDGCAAPGGKSFAAAIMMEDKGEILSCDINEKKLFRVREGADRLGLKSVHTRIMDAAVPDKVLFEKADVVIADVPCSGFGVIRKKPEIRYKREEDIAGLPALQLRIADNLARYVKPGGVMLYSTCTLLERENEGIVTEFLRLHGEFQLEPFDLPGPFGRIQAGMTTLWPHLSGTDGFFIARLVRRS